MDKETIKIDKYFSSNYVKIGEGLSRKVYDLGKLVVKIPKNSDGYFDNIFEREQFLRIRRREDVIPFVNCYLITIDCVPLLFCEKIEINIKGKELPDWVSWVDCQQVGINSRGQFVAYDL
jgi:hypothetical protein